MMKKLTKKFFNRSTLLVAQDLLGKILVFNQHQAIITETEAYIGEDDPACHAAKGKTKRNQVMYGAAGYSYVYMIYGMYYCLNIVTEEIGFPAAVLIRGAITINSFPEHIISLNKILTNNSKDFLNNVRYTIPTRQPLLHDLNNLNHYHKNHHVNLDGPGKLCRYLGITLKENQINLSMARNFYIKSAKIMPKINYIATPRIGIKVGLDKLWRFKAIF